MSSIQHTIVNELLTLRDVLRWTTSQFNAAELFYGHGNADAFNDALQLILHSLHLPANDFPELFADARLTLAEKHGIAALVERRITDRVPVPYLTHEAWFAGMPFYVDERVLIPRSPFAELIQDQFMPWITDPDSVMTILDLCTGGGCIAIACAEAFPDAHVDAIDISTDALAVANINIKKHELLDQVHTIESNLWSALSDHKYDLIVSNPPYVGADEMASLPPEYRHEPTSALEADDNGLALVEQILVHAAEFLTPEGVLFVEVGNSDLAVMEKWPDIEFLWPDFEEGGHGIFVLSRDQCVVFTQRYK
ncbi:MAG: 50S ribosomal protein L3 N(5)-glutamine methyltransferase [Pseudomonadota bacterium]|nr:50S ribosomal protein L3 N(5)-glutamine methyltransferase [Pseudomonadota bacterium]MDO7710556.1 50S ribosomal protein L3 N(5)-glutamine methyltransferase [Pseudomonadota bacterium]